MRLGGVVVKRFVTYIPTYGRTGGICRLASLVMIITYKKVIDTSGFATTHVVVSVRHPITY